MTLMRRGFVLLWLLLIVGGINGLSSVRNASAQSIPLEYQVKAAFLYQFSKFIEWPTHAFDATRNTLCIGVLTGGPMASALQSIEGKETKGRRVVVKRLTADDEIELCHILFIGRETEGRLTDILSRLKGTSTVTVSDIDGFATRGGMINLIMVDNKVQFEINVTAVERAKLQFSSHLLRLAKIVSEER